MDTNPLSGSQAQGENKLGGSQAQGDNPLSGSQAKGEEQISTSQGERVISERVVSERVLGSSNPLARMGRQAGNQISSRLGGVLIGIILILVSFYVIWKSEKFEKTSAIVQAMPVLTVEQALNASGEIKVQGTVTSTLIKTPKEDKDVLYYSYTKEALEMVKKTETETQIVQKNGQDVEQTIEKEVESPEWVTKLEEKKWAPIVLGGQIAVSPESARTDLNLSTVYSTSSDKEREKIEALLPGDLLVVGEISNAKISSGNPFIISNKSNEAVISSLQSGENFTWWLLKILTLVLFGGGLYLLLGPVLLVLDIIPILGKIGKTGLLIVCLLIGLVFTVFSSIIINYWYIILILLIALAVYLFTARKLKTQPQKPA